MTCLVYAPRMAGLEDILLGAGISLASSILAWTVQFRISSNKAHEDAVNARKWDNLFNALDDGLPLFQGLYEELACFLKCECKVEEVNDKECEEEILERTNPILPWMDKHNAILSVYDDSIFTRGEEIYSAAVQILTSLDKGASKGFKAGELEETTSDARALMEKIQEQTTVMAHLQFCTAKEIRMHHKRSQKLLKAKKKLAAKEPMAKRGS